MSIRRLLGSLAEILETQPQMLVGYAAPSIHQLSVSPSGLCTSAGPLRLADCPNARTTGATLVINGTAFGASGAAVLVGGKGCPDTQYLVPNTVLTCSLPYGFGFGLAVTVVQLGGSVSVEDASVSFELCPPGTYLDGGDACTNCSIGTVNCSFVACCLTTTCILEFCLGLAGEQLCWGIFVCYV